MSPVALSRINPSLFYHGISISGFLAFIHFLFGGMGEEMLEVSIPCVIPGAPASHGSLLEIQTLLPPPRLTESESAHQQDSQEVHRHIKV